MPSTSTHYTCSPVTFVQAVNGVYTVNGNNVARNAKTLGELVDQLSVPQTGWPQVR